MNTTTLILLGLIPIGYLVGSIPVGLLVGLARGVDPRKAGSGNIGATNVGRLLGGRYFALVFTLDALKGMLPTLWAGAAMQFQPSDAVHYLMWMAVGVGAILGHMFSLFLNFRGGKGVATSAGVLLGIWPYLTISLLLAMVVWGLTFYITRYISAASILGTISMPLMYLALAIWRGWPIFGAQLPLLVLSAAMATLIVFKHRGNIARIRAGTEHRAGRPKDEPSKASPSAQ